MIRETLSFLVVLLFALAAIPPAASLAREPSEHIGVKDHRRCSFVLNRFPGGGNRDASAQLSDEEIILNYLETVDKRGRFLIQGWRWHSMSLMRDAGRLEKLALRIKHQLAGNDVDRKPVEKAADYVIGFNMNGLHRIEQELFFPWLRKKLTTNQDQDVSKAFSAVMDEMDLDRQRISQLGVAVTEQAKIASTAAITDEKRSEAIAHVAQLSAALTSRTRGLFEREEKLLVPAVAAIVPESEQKSFNNKVIRKLGLMNSRLHLVGMHDTVWELKDTSERELFKESIPYVPRAMVPRWRRSLYEPRAGILDEQQ